MITCETSRARAHPAQVACATPTPRPRSYRAGVPAGRGLGSEHERRALGPPQQRLFRRVSTAKDAADQVVYRALGTFRPPGGCALWLIGQHAQVSYVLDTEDVFRRRKFAAAAARSGDAAAAARRAARFASWLETRHAASQIMGV